MKINKGFTFIELLVVITIMAVIFAAGVVSYSAISKNSRNARRKADLEAIRQALEMCRSIAGVYPTTIYPSSGSIVCNDTASTVTMKVTPLDPKPCDDANPTGTYRYVDVPASGTYTLTASCAEGETIQVSNP